MKKTLLLSLVSLTIALALISLSSAYYNSYTNYNEDYYIPSQYQYNIKITNNYYFDDYQAPHFYYPRGRYYQLNPEYGHRERMSFNYYSDYNSYSYNYKYSPNYNSLSPYYSDWHMMMYR